MPHPIRLMLTGAAAALLVVAATPALACGNFPFTQGPGLGTAGNAGRLLNIGDVVTATYSSPGAPTLRIFKSFPAPDVDLLPTTSGPISGSVTYTATATGSYTFSASRSGGDGQFASITYTCAAAVVPTPVPTLSEWAMILFASVLAGGAALYIQRRRVAVQSH